MAEKDITRINFADFAVSIIGIKQLMEDMAKTHSDEPDEEVRSFMVDRLERDYQIPNSAREAYGKAFVRKFRESLGQPSGACDNPFRERRSES